MARLPGLRCCDLPPAAPPPRPCLPPSQVAPRLASTLLVSKPVTVSGRMSCACSLEDRQTNGDLVSKVADMVLRRNDTGLDVIEATTDHENAEDVGQLEDFREDVMSQGVVGFEASGDFMSAGQKESDKRKEFNLLRYEAIKDELLLLTVGIGAACTVYCVLVFSLEAGISYAFGVAFSWLYLQLLDFGLSTFSSHFQNNIFNFELVPGMMGFFAYKAAALVQVYRDNDDLRLILPEDDPDYS
ncbi:hypothetical protein ZWY2020_029373 [Hordeum vulgare]|nr:hypothetical protein ZWY2020_029373 [Hordeum vulgare]